MRAEFRRIFRSANPLLRLVRIASLRNRVLRNQKDSKADIDYTLYFVALVQLPVGVISYLLSPGLNPTISLRDRAVKTRAPDDLNSLHWSRSSSTGAPAPLVQLHWYRATPNYFPTISLRDRAVKTRRSTGRRRRSTGTGQLWAGSFFCVVLACCADESVRSRVALYQRRGTREGDGRGSED